MICKSSKKKVEQKLDKLNLLISFIDNEILHIIHQIVWKGTAILTKNYNTPNSV